MSEKTSEINEDFMRGYQSAVIDCNGYTHARVMKILLFVTQELESFTKPDALQQVNNYAQNKEKTNE